MESSSAAIEMAQVLLTAFDTSMSKYWHEEDRRWRDEDRRWRDEDIKFRNEERQWRLQEKLMRETEIKWHSVIILLLRWHSSFLGESYSHLKLCTPCVIQSNTNILYLDFLQHFYRMQEWRLEDIEQRHVENARYLWTRFVEKNRRDVEEKSEQLKAISNLAALFAGFAVVTLTQFSIEQNEVSIIWITLYGILTAIAVGLMTIAMVTCTLILGSILKNGKSYVNEEAEEEFMFKCRAFVESYQLGDRPPFPMRTFENFWDIRCEDDWRRALQLYALGVLSFLISLIPIGWIKFYYSQLTACLFIGVIVLSIMIWLLVQYFWGGYLTTNSSRKNILTPESMQPVGLPFDWHLAPVHQQNQSQS